MATWADIKATLRLEELEDALGLNVSKRGKQHDASCPLPTHPGEDSHPSFSIHADKMAYYCFTCGVGGNLVELVSEVQGLDEEGALAFLAQYADVDFAQSDEVFIKQVDGWLSKERTKMKRDPVLPWFPSDSLDRFPYAHGFRGMSDDVVERFGLRLDKARSRGSYTGQAVLIPHVFKGQLVGWQERWLGDDLPVPKYTNTDDFPKRFTLYNYDRAAESQQTVIVVESVMTVAVLAMYGYVAVATFGASVHEEQIRLLSGFYDAGLILAFDNDGPGKKTKRQLTNALDNHVPLEVVPEPAGEKADLGDLTGPQIADILARKEPAFQA